ncbi:MAG: hypothetical protein R3F59_11000 [Myxococcota bacterium]
MIDLGQLLYLADGTVAAVAEGARTGALADPAKGVDPAVAGQLAAEQYWTATELPAPFSVTTQVTGTAPNAMLQVTGTVAFSAAFGLLALPSDVSYTQTIRLYHQ